jgi:hypothetical protein
MLLAILMEQLYLLMVDGQPGSYNDNKMVTSQKKIIFFKIDKVVGTSLELGLSENVGEGHIYAICCIR